MFPQLQTHLLALPPRASRPRAYAAFLAVLSLASALLSVSAINAASPTLVRDLYTNEEPAFAYRHYPVALGSVALFQGFGVAGAELWITDGTTLGTSTLRDIFPGPDPSMSLFDGLLVNGSMLFSADDGVHGRELWITDGTAAGTQILMDVDPGPGDGNVRIHYSDGNLVYFSASDGVVGTALWVSDGTAAGTIQLVDPSSSTSSILVIASDFTSNGNLVFFRGFDEDDGYELFATDGTTAGTFQVADIRVGADSSSPRGLVALGSSVFFSADDGVNGRELWRSDGTAVGTVRVAEINPTGSANPEPMGLVGSNLLFSADDGVSGRQLWKTNGATVTQLTSVSGSVGDEGAVLDGRLYFAAEDADGIELWRSNGLPVGTGQVADIWMGAGSGDPSNFATVGDRVIFSADDGVNGRELWATNGATTQLVANLDGAPTDSLSSSSPPSAVLSGDRLLFTAGPEANSDLWVTDGSAVGTVKLTGEETPFSSSPSSLTAWNGGVAFLARVDQERYDLYESDGTFAGTSSTEFLVPGALDRNLAGSMVKVGDTLFLVNEDQNIGIGEVDLWTWDGTSALEVASDFGGSFSFGPQDLTPADDTLVFRVRSRLHRNNGLAVGDAVNGEIPNAPELCIGLTYELVALGDRVVFSGFDNGDCELWVVDLTDNSSTLLMDFDPAASSTPDFLGVWNGKALFVLREGAAATELWATDGTVVGTQPVGASVPNFFFANGGAASSTFFFANLDQGLSEIWKTDGTASGTSLLLSLPAGDDFLVFLQAVDSGAYFLSESGIWFSDGTTPGTQVVMPGAQGIQAARTYGEKLILAAMLNAGQGRELFLVDGVNGTFEALPGLEPGVAGTSIEDAVVVGDTLYLSAFRQDVGTELFKLDLSPFPSLLFADDFESGDAGAWSITVP